MRRGQQTPEELLLDWHLDRLDEEHRAWIEAELQRDAELRAKNDRLGQILRPLDHWTVPPTPPHLADEVLRYVERSTSAPAVSMTPEEGPATRTRSRFLPLRELVAVAACIVLLMGVMVPMRARAQRTMCASNLGTIYQGARLYQDAFAGSLPFAGKVIGASWLPRGPKGGPFASNSRHVYLLIKHGYGPAPKDFICPACKDAEPMQVDDPAALDDFAGARHVCYDSLNLAGANPNLRPKAAIAYMSDTNPLFENGRFNESIDPSKANSPAHNHRGQRVLTLDGRADWETSPVYSPQGDNLWTVEGIRHYTGTETPTRTDDAFLIPGYPTTDNRRNGLAGE